MNCSNNKILIFCILLVCANFHCALSQISAPKFIRADINRLHFSPDSSSFLKMFEKLRQVQEGQVKSLRIVHIGGSHVQAGIWSNAFLSAIQSTLITAGGGYFVFPYKIAKTNSPAFSRSFTTGKWSRCRSVGREFCLPLGVAAMNTSTRDSSNIFGMALTPAAACHYVNIIRVYHNFNDKYSFTPIISDTIKMNRVDLPKKGYTEFNFRMPVDSVAFTLLRQDTAAGDFILFGFDFYNDLAPGIHLSLLGANGASATSFLKSELFKDQFASLNADLVILSLGVNDSQSSGFTKDSFVTSYDSLIARIKEASPNVAILLTTTTDNYIRRKTNNKRTVVAREATLELMNKHNAAVWDLFTVMGGLRSISKWYSAGLASHDKVHFNNRGYTLVGKLMYDAFIRSFEQFKTLKK